MTSVQKKQPFTLRERTILLKLVNRHRRFIETKKSDAASLEAKHRAWERVTAEYNMHPAVIPRDVKQLRKCLDNLKSKAKRQQQPLGGGPHVLDTVSDSPYEENGAEEEALETLPEINAESYSMENSTDSSLWITADTPPVAETEGQQLALDAPVTKMEVPEPSTCRVEMLEQVSDGSTQSFAGHSARISSSTVVPPAPFKERKNPQSRTAADSIETELHARLDKIQAEKEAMQEYHELRMKLAKDESALKMKLLKQKFENAKLKERLIALQIGKFGYSNSASD
ncbi:myb/SANT-like DNA-binding domain-containing protein 3 [Ornithodoros turicata]|uniref:myb/SANT-like DNA-binding domain-containing protein 3 n=1 Tax=Ornithodoros turicata TaxID=34597 RepID=UPI00313A4D0E